MTMIEADQVDLQGAFDLSVVGWDGVTCFRGYSVSVIPGVDDYVRLGKKE
jgi:hypothetical protein